MMDDDGQVCRATWFVEQSSGRWVPVDESLATQIEGTLLLFNY